MPTLVDIRPGHRETVDLHAPWWSDAKDETTGRYLERCVVYRDQTEEDQQEISRRLAPSMSAKKGAALNMDKAMSQARVETLRRMVVELTDAKGQPLPLTYQTFLALKTWDSEYIADQLDDLNRPPVDPTADDADEAARTGEDMQELAQKRFRRPGGQTLRR